MTANSESIFTLLKQVRHPEKGQDIVSLGLVTGVETDESSVLLTLSLRRNDPLRNSIRKTIERLIVQSFPGATVDITIAESPAPPPSEVWDSLAQVKNIIAIASGKGGVGKSTIASNLAVALAVQGYSVGLLDADIFGPSMPKMFALEQDRPLMSREHNRDLIVPLNKHGVKILSVGFFIPPDSATIWRGPMASNALKQLINDGLWGELDFLLIDLPPGTSDIHLTVVQTLALTGAVIVTTPQPVALADAIKGISMFRNDNIDVPILGIVENMSWFTPAELPENKYFLFGKEGGKQLAEKFNLPLLGQIPLVQSIREGGDEGIPQALEKSSTATAFEQLATRFVSQVGLRNQQLPPTKKVEITRTHFETPQGKTI